MRGEEEEDVWGPVRGRGGLQGSGEMSGDNGGEGFPYQCPLCLVVDCLVVEMSWAQAGGGGN